MKVCAAIVMLHEAGRDNSATRRFRDRPVLDWTRARLSSAGGITATRIVCFDDQLESVHDAVDDPAAIFSAGPRSWLPAIEAMAVARRWSDGWRGGLLNSSEYDLGCDTPTLLRLTTSLDADAVLSINASSGLIDPVLIDRLITQLEDNADLEMTFLPAAPGLGAMLLRRPLLARLAGANLTPGRLLSYQPDAPMRDPLASPSCVAVPLAVARSARSFKLDSQSQIARLGGSLMSLNGELMSSSAERVIASGGQLGAEPLPREIVLELTTRRATSPVFSAAGRSEVVRSDMTLAVARTIFEQAAIRDDVRITLAGVGDPLLHDQCSEIIAAAREAGVCSVGVETDLLPDDPGAIERIIEAGIEVVSVHLPAALPATYARLMGADAMTQVIANIQRLASARATAGRSVPIIAPTFVKSTLNLAELEGWYDQWLRAVGTAVIVAPTTFGGLIADVSVGDMSPPARVPCRRLGSRMTILSDGRVVRCEEDAAGTSSMGRIGEQTIEEIWQGAFQRLRVLHASNQWQTCGDCARCREWHRP